MAIGDEYSQREFFGKYLSLLGAKEKELGNILIDNTGLPNSVHFPLAAICNHNGEISSEGGSYTSSTSEPVCLSISAIALET